MLKNIELIEICIVFVASFLLTLVGIYILERFFLIKGDVAIFFSQSLSFFSVCAVYYKIKGEFKVLKNIFFYKASLDDFIYCFKVLSLVFLLSFAALIVGYLLFIYPYDKVESHNLDLSFLSYKFPLYFFTLSILGPIAEEIFSRGIVYSFLRQFFSVSVSVIVSAVLFALLHKAGLRFIYTFIGGIFLSYVYEKKRNLFHPILLHSLINVFGLILGIFLMSI